MLRGQERTDTDRHLHPHTLAFALSRRCEPLFTHTAASQLLQRIATLPAHVPAYAAGLDSLLSSSLIPFASLSSGDHTSALLSPSFLQAFLSPPAPANTGSASTTPSAQ